MKIHYLKHVPFEGLGSMEEYLQQSGQQISLTNLYNGDQLPNPEAIDLLIIMGGPMGVYDEQQYPWLKDEKAFIRDVIELNKPVLGICLGAQLIADVLGAKVSKNHYREIGWFDIQLNPEFQQTDIGQLLPNPMNSLHWHGDTFAIPKGAIALGSSDACANQGFLYKRNVLGLQFHLEMTRETVQRLISHCAEELDNSAFVQQPEQMLDEKAPYKICNHLMNKVIAYLININ